MKTNLSEDKIRNLRSGPEMDKLVASTIFGECAPLAYSTQMTSAWRVVERVREEYGTFTLAWDCMDDGSEWYCHIGQSAYGETPELAICRAALLAYYVSGE